MGVFRHEFHLAKYITTVRQRVVICGQSAPLIANAAADAMSEQWALNTNHHHGRGDEDVAMAQTHTGAGDVVGAIGTSGARSLATDSQSVPARQEAGRRRRAG